MSDLSRGKHVIASSVSSEFESMRATKASSRELRKPEARTTLYRSAKLKADLCLVEPSLSSVTLAAPFQSHLLDMSLILALLERCRPPSLLRLDAANQSITIAA